MSEGEELLRVVVFGDPQPQGSVTAFVPLDRAGYPLARGGRNRDGSYRKGSVVVNLTSDNPKLKGWRKTVAAAAGAKWEGEPIEGESLEVETHFFMERPKNHWGTGRNAHLLKDWAPAAPLTIPDVDKLQRAILDALTGVVYKDDNLVTCAPPEKHYAVPSQSGDGQGVRVIVRRRVQQTALDLPPEERERYVPPTAQDADDSQVALAF